MLKKKTKLIILRIVLLSCLPVFLTHLTQAQQEIKSILSQAKVEIPRLSPLPLNVPAVEKPLISLNGEWKVAIDGGEQIPVKVPGELVMQGLELNTGETARYQKNITIPGDWESKRVFVRFDGVSSYALVKVNGIKVAEHEGSFVPFEADITQALRQNNNVLQVEVRARTISDILACTSQYAAHTVAGILRKVTLFALPKTNIADITVNTRFDKYYRNATLQIETKIENSSAIPNGVQLRFTLSDARGKQVQQKTISINDNNEGARTHVSNITIPVKKPYHWNPESPYLYTLFTEIVENGNLLQKNSQKVGFRQVEVVKGEVRVNGKPIKLHGVNRHVVHPLTGRSLNPELDRLDATLFKEANCNYIRTSHYPASEEFLQAADELGLFVESESSLTWIQHHASPIWEHWNYQDERFLPYMLMANIENIQAYKGHPSVIIWSLANESRWSPLWDKVKQVVKKMDPHRPTSFHDQCWGSFNNAGSTADIANYHYPGINGPAATDTAQRPVLFGEYAHLTTYNRRELLTDPGVRDAYSQPLVTFYDSIYAHPNNLGGAIWSGIDDTFHLPDGRIVGYGPWGPLDGWRRPKPEYFGMKKAYSPVKVKNVRMVKGKILMEAENRYDFTSFSEIKIEAEINRKRVAVKSNIGPRQQGTIEIPHKEKVNTLKITFYDPNGFVAEEEYYAFSNGEHIESGQKSDLSLTENEEAYLVRQGKTIHRISKITGTVVSAQRDGQPVLFQGPKFTIVPMNREYGGKNNIAGETYQRVIHPLQEWPWYVKFASKIDVKEESDTIRFTMELTFKEGKGTMEYAFSSNGKFITRYEITEGRKEVSPYQYGLMLQLPKRFAKLSWRRKGDFTIYPEDHIGRNEGNAQLKAIYTSGVEPWRERPENVWKDDSNELGSNDFRSTKRNIFQASLSDDQGTTVTILSDARQASRTWLQQERIQWLIADYYNNGSEPFYGTPHSDGRISTKDKILKGEITLIIR